MKKIIISVILSSLLCFNAFSFGVESSVSLGDVTGVKEGISVVNTDYFNLSLGLRLGRDIYRRERKIRAGHADQLDQIRRLYGQNCAVRPSVRY